MLLVPLCAGAAWAAEPYDHPQIGRYSGSTVIHQETSRLLDYTVGLGAARDGKVADTLKVTGKVMMTLYSGPENASSFEVATAYRKLLQTKGFDVLFSCEKSGCGEPFLGAFYGLAPFANDPGWNHSAPITQGSGEFSYVLVAKSTGGGAVTYVSLIVSQGWWKYPAYKLDVVEIQDTTGEITSVLGPGQEAGGQGPGGREAGPVERRPVQFGVQVASDGYFGLMLCGNHFELCAKSQAVFYEGFPGDDWPEPATLVVGGHAMYLFRPAGAIDLATGADFRMGMTLAEDTVDGYSWEQYIDAGLRVGVNYHLGEHFMISGALYPVWVSTRETTENDSFSLTLRAPSAAVAVSLLF